MASAGLNMGASQRLHPLCFSALHQSCFRPPFRCLSSVVARDTIRHFTGGKVRGGGGERVCSHLLKAIHGLLSHNVGRQELHQLSACVGGVRGAVGIQHVAHDQHCRTVQ